MRFALGALLAAALAGPTLAATYYVNAGAENAADDNLGSAAQPWQTISRAAGAQELQPGDMVEIATGVYRESVHITVSGEEGRPITFQAAPGARVVVKGSEVVKGRWTKLSEDPNVEEPYPNAFTGIWKIQLGDEFFTDPDFTHSYEDPARRWVSQVFIQDNKPLQLIGPDPIYRNEEYVQLRYVGRGLADMIEDSFFFDAADQTLYAKIPGEPAWYSIEVGVRGWVLTANSVHDVVIRGLELRQNRQPGGQWSAVSIGDSERVLIEGCRIAQADYCGLGVGRSRNCIVRACDLSHNGDMGLNLHKAEDCLVEDCTLLFNNYRRFHSGWSAGGMKNIPDNKRCTIRNCEAAYNIASDGIWFDSGNEEIRIIGSVSHHNDGCGIFFEINKGGGVIADNLVYANGGRGIYISGSQKTWVVHNTVAANDCGIVAMPRGADWPLEDVQVLNNLCLDNYVIGDQGPRGNDLRLFMGSPGEYEPYERTVMSNHSDYNGYSNVTWSPTLRHTWNPDNTLEQWRARWQEDLHSVLAPVGFELPGTGFRLLSTDGLNVAGPVPEAAGWRPDEPGRVGCSRTQWPD